MSDDKPFYRIRKAPAGWEVVLSTDAILAGGLSSETLAAYLIAVAWATIINSGRRGESPEEMLKRLTEGSAKQ